MTQWDWDLIYAMVGKYGYTAPLLDLGGWPDCAFVDYGRGIRKVKGEHLWCGFAPLSECRYSHAAEEHAREVGSRYGTIVSTAVLEHVDNPFTFMQSVKDLLQDGGLAVLTTVFMWQQHGGDTDHWRFATPGLTELAKVSGLICLQVGYHSYSPTSVQSYLVCSKGELRADRSRHLVVPETEAAQ